MCEAKANAQLQPRGLVSARGRKRVPWGTHVRNEALGISAATVQHRQETGLQRYCNDLVIHSNDFVTLILLGQDGLLGSYLYANHFMDKVPHHLHPNAEEHAAMQDAKAGPLNDTSKKFLTKVAQMFEERRCIAAHLFYTPCHTHWHLFRFDQRDRSTEKNHWEQGPHIHLTSSLWPGQRLRKVWGRVKAGDKHLPSGIHLRYLDDEAPF